MLGLFPAAREKGLNPRAQWIPSIGGSCCVFKDERSSGPATELELWPSENAASNMTNKHGSNHVVFIDYPPSGWAQERFGWSGSYHGHPAECRELSIEAYM